MTITIAAPATSILPANGTVRVWTADDESEMTAQLLLEGGTRAQYQQAAKQLAALRSIKHTRIQGRGTRMCLVITFKSVVEESELHGLAHTLSNALGVQLTVSKG